MRAADIRPLWLTENYPPGRGGMAQSCDRIVRSLRGRGVAVTVAHLSPRHANWRVETRLAGRDFLCPVGADPAHTLNRLWGELAHAADASAFTHVVAFGGLLPLLAAPAYAAWLGVPLVTLLRGNDFDAGVFSLRRGDVLREALSRAARVCVVTREHARKVAALYPNVPTVWTPNGIDHDEWALTPGDRAQAEDWRRAHVPAGRRVLGLFGHLKQKKGGPFFLEALLRSGQAARFHLLLVGEWEPELGAWLGAHQGELSFSTRPFLDRYELLPYYAACDLVVLPSFYDGLPNVLVEAAALGVPALASTAGGMADFLADGEHAVLFRPGDPHDCRAAIERAAALADEELRRLGAHSRALARSAFTLAAEADNYLNVLGETLAPRAAPVAEFQPVG
ncbi:MAG TPA: glycosyltransferase family 4 protein [Pyrinomonadaceae bacterium]|jgi:glycosyltransferase involved in cell wall biosynthesis